MIKQRLREMFSVEVIHLAIPIIVEQTLVVLMGMVNSIMASSLGEEAISGIGMVDSINNILLSFFNALAVGATVVVAHYIGRRDWRAANETVKQSLYTGILLSLLVALPTMIFQREVIGLFFGATNESVQGYANTYLGWSAASFPMMAVVGIANGALRGTGDSKTPMMVTLQMNVINIALSYLFIYGIHIPFLGIDFRGWGVAGAAAGIMLARTAGAVIILYKLMRGKVRLRLIKTLHFKPQMDIQRSVLGIGLPSSMENVIFNGGKLILQVYIVAMGTAVIAANYYASMIFNLMNLPGMAISLAATSIVGQYIGRGDKDGARRHLLNMNWIAAILMLLTGVIFYFIAPLIVGIYNPGQQVTNLTVEILRIAALALPLIWPWSFVMPAGMRGAGDVKFTMVVAIASMWIFRIGMSLALMWWLDLGLHAIWYAMYIDWLVRAILFTIRFFHGKWMSQKVLRDRKEPQQEESNETTN